MLADIAIRRARPRDIDRISQIEQESFVDPWKAAVFAEALSYFPESFFVATVSGEVVGFVLGGLEDTGEEIYGHICNLAVTPAWRKRGIARRLVERVEQQFAVELATGVQLEVRVSNRAAQQFYRRLGYRPALRFKGYYANGEDAIVMMKWFR
ncbi:MAG TPA: ribosomal protein S18-alanine N-acetyltransferase [Methanolinea sp.]|nr:ribosomal protein S18-alanine N-acetyltransferase [Methanolinea sp.]HQK56422.1 ribosomal protein S18-alanine N-acetyltransferase [Methanolinea sp.]